MIENLIVIILISLYAMCALAVVESILYLIKNEVTYRNHRIIGDAIFYYQMHLIEEGRFDLLDKHDITFDDMEDYDVTLKRFWDWGYTRILPPEKFELIKPFIKRKMKGGE